MKFTSKQGEIMATILKGNPDGTALDIDQLLEALPYRTSKQSLQFSLRALIKHGMIAKGEPECRRSRNRVVITPTGLGYTTFGATPRSGADEGKANALVS